MNYSIRRYLKIPMRDGINLTGDLFYPDKISPPYPTLIFRTPYDRDSLNYRENAKYFAENGYAVLNVDVRGRGDSDGEFVPYLNEGNDGFDVISWVNKQDWCNGQIGTYGGSYSAKIQWLTAILSPPGLKTMISIVAPSDPFVESPTGIEEPMHLSWRYLVSGRTNKDNKEPDWNKIYWKIPIASMVDELGFDIPDYREGLKHQIYDVYWKRISYQDKFPSLDIPVLHISGWYDDEQIGTFINFIGMKTQSKTEFSRQNQGMIIGPWGHDVNRSSKLGDIDFGPDSVINLKEIQLKWFDKFLKNKENEIPRVDLFVMGINRWEHYKDWPPEGSEKLNFYLSSISFANSRFGDGKLEIRPHGKEYDEYVYDPENPVPFITNPTAEQIGGPDDYSSIERRDDILVYTSDEMKNDLKIVGPVEVKLYVKSDARDTDFIGMLTDVWPNGFSQRLCDGIVRARYRYGMDRMVPMDDQIYEINLNLWNTGHVFRTGHKIRLDITSSFFPKYSRNLNTGEDLAFSSHLRKAKNRIYHDKIHRSMLTLLKI